ncbi:DUF2505 domain-containing protein [Nocardia sp. CDC159]|uniref:DUF2505 domain-containing protein n=1 Tax=Nocardia pulmonis TaxID=2951408 RepID=A0A9X2E739_9NOCA|nr:MULTISPECIES: DUF2505 domain-containing protein [Nocardia]MCM6774845.1 DUF2505 domain-containing protein [Nocardia pulmonis]MCM6789776.1 DUF2505 domain-containing protein [Nocardia sp. CDC159]
MATPLAYTAHYSHPAAAVRAAIADEQYWKDRIAEVGGPGARIDGFEVSGDQLRVQMVQSIAEAELPTALTSVRPGDLIIPRTETYTGSSGLFEAHVDGAPAEVRGTVTLTGDDSSATISVEGTVEVKVPLFGKKIEAVVAEKLTELLAAEAEFTGNWIATH